MHFDNMPIPHDEADVPQLLDILQGIRLGCNDIGTFTDFYGANLPGEADPVGGLSRI